MAAPTFSLMFMFMFMVAPCHGWDSGDLELFDLVEEINENFYHVFGIDQSANSSDVRKAYRRLSLQYHPDKNSAENAEDKFRQIVAVYEVLKDDKKRERYNQVLAEGLPDWRQPVYYYRRARKMGVYELGILLSIIITVGQYFVAWAVYLERRLVLEEILSSKKKKEKKKKKQAAATDESSEDNQLSLIPRPHFLDLWPFRLSLYVCTSVYYLPEKMQQWKERRKRMKDKEEVEVLEQDEEVEEFVRKPKKRAPLELPEYTEEMYAKYSAPTESRKDPSTSDLKELQVMSPTHRKGEWTDEDLVLLSKAVNKFPGGTHQRWEKISEMVGRPVNEVINKAKETKGNYLMNLGSAIQNSLYSSKLASGADLISEDIITQKLPEDDSHDASDNPGSRADKLHTPRVSSQPVPRLCPVPQKVILTSSVSTESASQREPWTQNQQKIFEWALKQYPKSRDKRWDLIAEHIPGKSKEDCLARFKELAQLVSQRKKSDVQESRGS